MPHCNLQKILFLLRNIQLDGNHESLFHKERRIRMDLYHNTRFCDPGTVSQVDKGVEHKSENNHFS